ncbi:MAG TPA: tetratricopeptide repeat protein [Polyangiaceae bacterium]|nr:tetratricopeptide repeat protein [Polyangiaceae bacterium]
MLEIAAATALLLVAVWAQWGLQWSNRFGTWCLYRGRRTACRAAIVSLNVHPNPYAGSAAARMRIRLLADEARTSLAISELEGLVSSAILMKPLNSAQMIDIWVNAGKYRAAILAPRRFRWGLLRRHLPDLCEIANINRAEALHNIGRNDLALKLLTRTPRANPISVSGGAMLEAWILADEGRTDAARALYRSIDARPLCPYYWSETLYTRALIELSAGEYDLAFVSVSDGLARAIRVSSERNGLFLLGRVEALRGNLDRAIAHYEGARRHRYRGQSARGLFELGQLYERQNRPAAARSVYAQAIEEDAESVAATRCHERMAALASEGVTADAE